MINNTNRVSRRKFLGLSAAAATFAVLPAGFNFNEKAGLKKTAKPNSTTIQAGSSLSAGETILMLSGERDVVRPIIGDKLTSVRLTHQELEGGEIDRRIMDLVSKNYMVLDLDRDWLDKFKNRTDRGDKRNVYYGIGKVLDAGSLFAQYTGDTEVNGRVQYIMDQLRS